MRMFVRQRRAPTGYLGRIKERDSPRLCSLYRAADCCCFTGYGVVISTPLASAQRHSHLFPLDSTVLGDNGDSDSSCTALDSYCFLAGYQQLFFYLYTFMFSNFVLVLVPRAIQEKKFIFESPATGARVLIETGSAQICCSTLVWGSITTFPSARGMALGLLFRFTPAKFACS